MLIDQEEKFKKTLESLTEKVSEQQLFNRFLELYPEDWKQLKITFSKFTRSKQANKTIPLPKPEQALRKAMRIWLKKQCL